MAGSTFIPDPNLTLSEAVNMHAVVRDLLKRSRSGGDAVLQSACNKLIASANIAAEQNPEAFEAVQAEVALQRRFGGG